MLETWLRAQCTSSRHGHCASECHWELWLAPRPIALYSTLSLVPAHKLQAGLFIAIVRRSYIQAHSLPTR